MSEINNTKSLDELIILLSQVEIYDYVYVSLGSKMNERHVSFSYPFKIEQHISNAEYQMIPDFIRLQPESNKILCIVIDDFHNETIYKWNKSYLENLLKVHKNIHTILFDQNITLHNVTFIIKTITNLLKQYICPTRFLLCNYICFKNSNLLQLEFENKLPNKILNAMDITYKECFYQWCGYAYYTYNYIYNYKSYYLMNLMNKSYITKLLHNILKEDQLNIYNIDNVNYEVNNKMDRKWISFHDNTICIT